MKTCSGCRERKVASEFSKASSRPDGLQGECKKCAAKRHKEYARRKGKEHFRDAARRYGSTTRGRAYRLWKSATARGVVTITPEWIAERLEIGHCEMSGLRFHMKAWKSAGDRHPRSPSLDRIDPSKGYVPGNVRVVCWQVNLARNSYGDAALFEMCRAISSQVPKGKGSETIPKGSRGQAASKRPEPARVMI